MIARVVLIFTILIHISLGLYIRPAKENKTTKPVVENMKSDAGEWKMFQQMLNLTDKKVHCLRASPSVHSPVFPPFHRKLLSHSNNINYGEPDNNIPRDDKLHNFICDDSIIFYKNDYKSEGEVSMQDLIFQAVLDYWRQDMEERKFMNSRQE
ncbi:hypothetical protein GQX74_015089 [Glossina fuscipes]|nr:hypothetical protein GQX74_015089 [Glossina fuscipes]